MGGIKQWLLHCQFLLTKTTFSLALLHSFASVIIYISGGNKPVKQKLWRIDVFFKCCLDACGHHSNIMGLIKIASVPSTPAVILFLMCEEVLWQWHIFPSDIMGPPASPVLVASAQKASSKPELMRGYEAPIFFWAEWEHSLYRRMNDGLSASNLCIQP